ncbi:hypothetical protein [Sulfuricaulis sp.]|jgi:hypothetical protein|uniref:hypothetical protein n=1 Tax=Sulfuricaulis sp. TaxID=2003553 RepID=UPI003559EBAA
MTRLLLDYPWTIEEGLGSDSVPYKVILDFLDLLARTELKPVPFIDHEECNIFWTALKGRKGQSRFGPVIRLLRHCTRDTDGICLARPVPEPTKLRDSWKCALRDELEHLENWRNPQIIFPEVRRPAWQATDEIEIQCEDRKGTVSRVLASLEKYDSHPYAVPDLDPWRHLDRLFPPKPGNPNNKPCWLPKPPILDQVPVEQISEGLEEARKQGWQIKGKYYFIPPADCFPEQIEKPEWRSGYVFAREKIHGWKGPCPIDYYGVTWRWDRGHRHWDVQTDPYISVSHTGELD